MKNKILLAAGIVRDIQFSSQDVLDVYLYSLDHRKVTYQILDTFARLDGSVIIRIVTSYNNSDLIQL